MKSKWKISCNVIDGKKIYQVYRILDLNVTDHSGNREYYGDYLTDRDQAKAQAERLNSGKGGNPNDLAKAAMLIKKYCAELQQCSECVFYTKVGVFLECALVTEPFDWIEMEE